MPEFIENHLEDNASLDGKMFETYGEELAFVRSQPPDKIWTHIDNGTRRGKTVKGYRLVNRLGYLIEK